MQTVLTIRGIAFNSFIPGAGKAYPRANYIIVTPVKIKIRGTFLQILTFLDSIAHLTRVVSIERLKLKIDGVRNKSTILEADVSMSTYHLDGVKLARAARRKADRKNKEEKKDK